VWEIEKKEVVVSSSIRRKEAEELFRLLLTQNLNNPKNSAKILPGQP
jgi:hypothetical protein